MVLDWVSFGEPLTFWQMLLRIVAAVVFGTIIGVDRREGDDGGSGGQDYYSEPAVRQRGKGAGKTALGHPGMGLL